MSAFAGPPCVDLEALLNGAIPQVMSQWGPKEAAMKTAMLDSARPPLNS